ncbi:MAG: DUF4198 domain-containing protein [Deltaproteobacteria bacterium]|nr:DUF4198 domain-containing protein [Deltaproteobacteria bacterium]
MSTYTRVVLFIGFLSLFATSVQAHHLWLDSEGGGYRICRGIFPGKQEPYDSGRIVAVQAFGPDGTVIQCNRGNDDRGVTVFPLAPPALMTAVAEWGERVNTPEGKKLISRQEALDQGMAVLSSFNSTQYTKCFFEAGEMWFRPIGLPLEIIPLSGPEGLVHDAKSRFQVIFDGHPLASAEIMLGKGSYFSTDENGIFEYEMEDRRQHILIVRHTDKTDGENSYRQYMSFLVFFNEKGR